MAEDNLIQVCMFSVSSRFLRSVYIQKEDKKRNEVFDFTYK